MTFIYHITSREAWAAAQRAGEYRAESLAREGFIHCSAREQVLRTARTFFAGAEHLLLLKIDAARLRAPLRREPGADAPESLFLHLYGALNLDAVTEVCPFSPEEEKLPC